MIRQAHTYVVGALSGVVVIGIAIAAFVVLVSAQVFHDLPIPALSSSDQKAAAVSRGKALNGGPDHRVVATTGGASTGTAQPDHAIANANTPNGVHAAANNAQPAGRQGTPVTPTQSATAPGGVETAPNSGLGTTEQGSDASGKSSGGSHPPPSSNSHTPSSSSNSGSTGGGNATATSGSSAAGTSGGGSTSGSGSSSGAPAPGSTAPPTTTTPPAAPVTTGKLSEALTESVNGTVGAVDEALGGALGDTGVTKVTEEVVNGAAGPESVVGKTVDGVGEVVGGLVNGQTE